MAPLLRWAPRKEVTTALTHLCLPDLDLFIEGYVDGWITLKRGNQTARDLRKR
ncbi:hypothetical protein ABZ769_08215 [Streptomyces olivoreticuli]